VIWLTSKLGGDGKRQKRLSPAERLFPAPQIPSFKAFPATGVFCERRTSDYGWAASLWSRLPCNVDGADYDEDVIDT